MNRESLHINTPLQLELGDTLDGVTITYSTAGTLNKAKNNVAWVFHALTANDNPFEWWPGLVGENTFFNPDKYFIVCANVLGSCYGSTGPNSIELPIEQQGLGFPKITVRDVVKAHEILAEHLQVKTIKYAIGGSFGGYQAFEFSLGKLVVENLIIVASATTESPWNIAIHETQRMAIKSDHTLSHTQGGLKGVETARGIGLLTYRTPSAYVETQPRAANQVEGFKAASYINYQGKKLADRFSAQTYLTLLDCLDTHDISRGFQSLEQVLASITSNTLCIGIEEDLLACPKTLEEDCKHIQKSHFELISSKYGHDGFLLETEKLTQIITNYFN